MTTTHHRFGLDLTGHHRATLPGVLDDNPVSSHAATLTLRGDGRVICRWDELDIDAALTDFETGDSFDVGTDWHIDLYYTGDGDVSVLVWCYGETEPAHRITVTETDFFACLEDARQQMRAQALHLA